MSDRRKNARVVSLKEVDNINKKNVAYFTLTDGSVAVIKKDGKNTSKNTTSQKEESSRFKRGANSNSNAYNMDNNDINTNKNSIRLKYLLNKKDNESNSPRNDNISNNNSNNYTDRGKKEINVNKDSQESDNAKNSYKRKYQRFNQQKTNETQQEGYSYKANVYNKSNISESERSQNQDNQSNIQQSRFKSKYYKKNLDKETNDDNTKDDYKIKSKYNNTSSNYKDNEDNNNDNNNNENIKDNYKRKYKNDKNDNKDIDNTRYKTNYRNDKNNNINSINNYNNSDGNNNIDDNANNKLNINNYNNNRNIDMNTNYKSNIGNYNNSNNDIIAKYKKIVETDYSTKPLYEKHNKQYSDNIPQLKNENNPNMLTNYKIELIEVIPVRICENYNPDSNNRKMNISYSYSKPQYVQPYFNPNIIVGEIFYNDNKNIKKSNVDYIRDLYNSQVTASFNDFDNLQEYEEQGDFRNDEIYRNVDLKYSDISAAEQNILRNKNSIRQNKGQQQQYIRPFTNVEMKNKSEIKGVSLMRKNNTGINNHKLTTSYGARNGNNNKA